MEPYHISFSSETNQQGQYGILQSDIQQEINNKNALHHIEWNGEAWLCGCVVGKWKGGATNKGNDFKSCKEKTLKLNQIVGKELIVLG